jgi:nucleoid-associated protein YgaU
MSEMKIIAKHTVKEGETLSHLSSKYYGSTDKAKWMLIYEANKTAIGDNPSVIRPGLVLNIPSEEQPAATPHLGKPNRQMEE